MKVLLAFPFEDQQTGVYIFKAFEQNGCEVIGVDSKLYPWHLYETAMEFRPDLIFCSRTPALLDSVLKIKKNLKTKIMCWNVDVRDTVREFSYLFPLFDQMDVLYSIGVDNVKEYHDYVKTPVIKWLSEGVDPDYHNMFNLTDRDHKLYDCDIMFAGEYPCQYRHSRNQIVEFLAQVYGNKFRLFGNTSSNYLLNEEHSKACQCAKVCIGNSGWPDVTLSMSARDYRILAGGGILLTNYVKGIEDWFPADICTTYHDINELNIRLQDMLSMDSFEAKERHERASKFVLENHTFKHRIKEVLDDFKSL